MKRIKKAIWRKRHSKGEKFIAVGVLLVVELAFASLLWVKSKPVCQKGYLIKNGGQYIVYWRDENENRDMKVSSNLKEALAFAKDELNLIVGADGLSQHPLEHLWLRSSVGEFVLYWKTMDLQYLNRLTFQSREDAQSFEKSFRLGAYSPSPIGHAISLIPANKN